MFIRERDPLGKVRCQPITQDTTYFYEYNKSIIKHNQKEKRKA